MAARSGGELVSVNVGASRLTEWHGRRVQSAIWKAPVPGRVGIRGGGLVRDEQADRRVHGGRDKAVYAYAVEDYEWWSDRVGHGFEPGTFGENLTVRGLDLSAMVIGTRWSVGSAVLEVAQPRMPCFKLGMRMGDAGFVKRFERAARFGAYLRVAADGEVGAGDAIAIGEAPPGGPTIRDVGQRKLPRSD